MRSSLFAVRAPVKISHPRGILRPTERESAGFLRLSGGMSLAQPLADVSGKESAT
jgi:hypothetical protein